jgi:UDP:flavonoid glycosyltransferase YjiC (YdhE family)
VLSPAVFVSAYDPPVFPPFPWLHGLRRLGPGPHQAVRWALKKVTRSWMEPIARLREREGLSRTVCAMHDDMFSPHGTLAWFSPLFSAPQPDWPVNSEATGFPFYDRAQPDQRPDAELDDFLNAGEPPVVFTLGSSAVTDAGDFFEQSLAAVAKIGRRAVFLVGRQSQNLRLAGLSKSVLVVPYAPFSELMPRAVAVVHQGGVGTTGHGLHAGVPMLVVPLGLDQPDNAFRVARLGVARVLPRRHYCAERAVQELCALLDQPRYAARAADLGERIRGEDGVASACAALERICGSASVRHRLASVRGIGSS